MASLIARVTSTGPRSPLARLVTSSLGLDVWEVDPEYVVLQAEEAQADRLEAMGYAVEQLQLTEAYLSDFATDAAVTGYHSAAGLEADLRAAGRGRTRSWPSCTGSAPASRAGRSGRCGWGSAANSTHEGRLPRLPPRPRVGLGRGALPAGRRPAGQLLDRPGAAVVADGEIWVAPMVNPDGHEFTRTDARLWRKNRRRNAERQHRRRPEPELRLHVGHARRRHVQPRAVGRDLRRAAGVLRAGDPRGAQPGRRRSSSPACSPTTATRSSSCTRGATPPTRSPTRPTAPSCGSSAPSCSG